MAIFSASLLCHDVLSDYLSVVLCLFVFFHRNTLIILENPRIAMEYQIKLLKFIR